MKMQTLDFKSNGSLETKLATEPGLTADVEAGTVSGYAAVFNVMDSGGDVILPDAVNLDRTNKAIKMLWQHDPSAPIGIWDDVSIDDRGLYVKGRLLEGVQQAKEAATLLRAGAVDGLSIGYRTIEAQKIDGVRHLKEIDIWEVSIVTFPMNHLSRIDAVKAASMTDREIEKKLTQDAGFSRSVARALMQGGLPELRAMQDAGDENGVKKALLELRNHVRQ